MLKKLASQTAVYGLSSILARLVNYLLVPLHTYAFETTADYGILAYFYAIVAFLNVVYTHGMETAYFRFASKEDADPEKVYQSALTSVMFVSVCFSGSMYAFSDSIAAMLGFVGQSHFIRWFALILAIDAFLAIPFARLRQENKAYLFAGVRLLMVFANVGLNFFFLYICKNIYEGNFWVDWQGWVNQFYDPTLGPGYAFLCNLIANALAIPVLIRYFLKWRPRIDVQSLLPLWKYGYPLIFSGVAFAMNEALDRIVLPLWLPDGYYPGKTGFDASGIYSACYRLSIFITIAVQGYRYAAEPFFFAKAKEKDSPQAYAQVMRYFVIACCAMMIAVVANLDWIAQLFLRQPAYREGLSVVPVLLLANVLLGIYYNLAVWFKITDRTYMGAFIGLGGATVTVTGNYFLIPLLGYHGSAVTTLLCYGSMAIVCYLIGQKYYPVPYTLARNTLYLLGSIVLSILLFQLETSWWWLDTLLGNLSVVLALSIIYRQEKYNLKIVWSGERSIPKKGV